MTQDENLRDSVDSTEAAVSRAEEARRRKASHARSGEAEVPPTRRAGFHPLAREPKSTVQIGDVRYYDGAELSRPLETPPRVRAIMLAAMKVKPPISETMVPVSVPDNAGAKRISRYTPALTMVALCKSALDGVGATMAPSSQEENGSWADFVSPARERSATGITAPAATTSPS